MPFPQSHTLYGRLEPHVPNAIYGLERAGYAATPLCQSVFSAFLAVLPIAIAFLKKKTVLPSCFFRILPTPRVYLAAAVWVLPCHNLFLATAVWPPSPLFKPYSLVFRPPRGFCHDFPGTGCWFPRALSVFPCFLPQAETCSHDPSHFSGILCHVFQALCPSRPKPTLILVAAALALPARPSPALLCTAQMKSRMPTHKEAEPLPKVRPRN